VCVCVCLCLCVCVDVIWREEIPGERALRRGNSCARTAQAAAVAAELPLVGVRLAVALRNDPSESGFDLFGERRRPNREATGERLLGGCKPSAASHA
jgi:hypothetical protein